MADLTQFDTNVTDYVEKGKAMMAAEAHRRAVMRRMKFNTIAVHGIYNMEAALANQGSIIEPVYESTAQHFENSDHLEAALAYRMPAWTYARFANPTQHYLEETLALLEGYGYDGEVSAVAVGSGMAALFLATFPFLSVDPARAPMNIVATARCYGGTFTLFTKRYAEDHGVEIRWVTDPLDLDQWASKIDAGTRFVFGEMPSNPSLAVCDVAGVADIAHAHGLPFIIDSTIATPALLRPLALGADIVVHSVSKTMMSSGSGIAGAVIARHDLPSRVGSDELRANFALDSKRYAFRDYGAAISPATAFNALSELRTLRGKIDQLSQTTMQVAQFLASHPRVEDVFYPGLPSHPGHALAQKSMWLVDSADDYGQPVNRYGHLVSFTVKGGANVAREVFDRFALIFRATDLGRIKSVATIPAISTHQQQGDAGRALAQIPPHLIRLSVGGEHPADIIADLDQALGR